MNSRLEHFRRTRPNDTRLARCRTGRRCTGLLRWWASRRRYPGLRRRLQWRSSSMDTDAKVQAGRLQRGRCLERCRTRHRYTTYRQQWERTCIAPSSGRTPLGRSLRSARNSRPPALSTFLNGRRRSWCTATRRHMSCLRSSASPHIDPSTRCRSPWCTLHPAKSSCATLRRIDPSCTPRSRCRTGHHRRCHLH